jgi:hypothetical protein
MNEHSQAALLLGSGFLAAALYWAWVEKQTGLYGLGDDPFTPPAGGDYDPRKADKSAFLRTHIAKKFWGSTVLAAQGSVSLEKLNKRIRKYSPTAADEANAISHKLWNIHSESLALAKKYNEPWVAHRMQSAGFPSLTEG